MSFTEPASGWPFYFILSMVFFFGMMFGAVLAWFMIYPYFNRVTLIHSDIIPRPTFLMHALPREDRAPRPIESEPRRSQSTSSSTARAADAAGGTAGPISSALAAGSTARAADLPTSRAAGPTSAAAAVPTSSTTEAAANERANLRSRRTAVDHQPLYVSPSGQKYHFDDHCHGLRNARQVSRCFRCEQCGPTQPRPLVAVYGYGAGHPLHGSMDHCRSTRGGGEIKTYEPCAICMSG